MRYVLAIMASTSLRNGILGTALGLSVSKCLGDLVDGHIGDAHLQAMIVCCLVLYFVLVLIKRELSKDE